MDDGFWHQFTSLFSEYDVLGAFWVNVQLTVFAGLIALVVGTALALMRISPVPSLQWAGATYVTLLRNTPLTIIVVFFVLGVWGQLGVTLSSSFTTNFFRLAVVALAVYHAAFVCEALRSGVNTVPVGQAEAARSIGLSFWPAARLVIMPQAFRGAVVPLGNVLIALIKNSALVSLLTIDDLMHEGQKIISVSYRSLEVYLAIALVYLVLTQATNYALHRVERRLRAGGMVQ